MPYQTPPTPPPAPTIVWKTSTGQPLNAPIATGRLVPNVMAPMSVFDFAAAFPIDKDLPAKQPVDAMFIANMIFNAAKEFNEATLPPAILMHLSRQNHSMAFDGRENMYIDGHRYIKNVKSDDLMELNAAGEVIKPVLGDEQDNALFTRTESFEIQDLESIRYEFAVANVYGRIFEKLYQDNITSNQNQHNSLSPAQVNLNTRKQALALIGNAISIFLNANAAHDEAIAEAAPDTQDANLLVAKIMSFSNLHTEENHNFGISSPNPDKPYPLIRVCFKYDSGPITGLLEWIDRYGRAKHQNGEDWAEIAFCAVTAAKPKLQKVLPYFYEIDSSNLRGFEADQNFIAARIADLSKSNADSYYPVTADKLIYSIGWRIRNLRNEDSQMQKRLFGNMAAQRALCAGGADDDKNIFSFSGSQYNLNILASYCDPVYKNKSFEVYKAVENTVPSVAAQHKTALPVPSQ